MIDSPRTQEVCLQQIQKHGGEPKAEGVEDTRPRRKEQTKQL